MYIEIEYDIHPDFQDSKQIIRGEIDLKTLIFKKFIGYIL